MAPMWGWCFWSVQPDHFLRHLFLLSLMSLPPRAELITSFLLEQTSGQSQDLCRLSSPTPVWLLCWQKLILPLQWRVRALYRKRRALTLSCNVVSRSVVSLDNREKHSEERPIKAHEQHNGILSRIWLPHMQNENSIRHFPEKRQRLNKIMHINCLVDH